MARARSGRRSASLPWRRILSFSVLQAFSAVAPLLVLPVVVGLVDVRGWVALSLGYVIGATASIAVNYGWPMTGPSRIASLGIEESVAVFLESLWMRCLVAVPSLIVAVVVAVALAPSEFRLLSALMVVAVASSGLASNWYYIGKGDPGGILKYEALPKLVGTLSAIPVVALTHRGEGYPICLLVATMGGTLMSCYRIVRLAPHAKMPRVGLRRRVVDYGLVASAAVLGAGYTSLALPIMQISGGSLTAIADMAGGLRLRTMTQTAVSAGTTALQGWVAEKGVGTAGRHRMKVALVGSAALGGGCCIFLTVLGPPLADLLFGSAAHVGFELALLTGAACVPYALSASLSFHILAPLEKWRPVAASRVAGTVIGVPLIVGASAYFGAAGTAAAMLIAESVVVLIQARLALVALRKPSGGSDNDVLIAGV